MAKQINLSKFVDEFAGSTLKKELKKYSEAGKKAAKEIRDSIVMNWFGEYNYTSVVDATKYVPYTKMFDNYTAQIDIHSYVVLSDYKAKPKAQKWVDVNGGKWDAKYYVLSHLQMTEGIIGLPERSKAYPERNWTNEHFVQRDVGLRDAIVNESNWSNWESMVNLYKK